MTPARARMPAWRIVTDLQTIAAKDWARLETGGNPFLSYPFLAGLEQYGCLQHQYWQPCHIAIEDNGALQGLLPLYVKQDSYGEFVFDWAWAEAYQRAGRRYYPKLVSAIPFTPVAGPRLLINKTADKADIQKMLIGAAVALMRGNNLSSLHFLFPAENDAAVSVEQQALQRLTCQYHWFNRGYRDFQDFTGAMTSKKRKQLLRERRAVREAGVEIERLGGADISAEQWETFYHFYCATFYKKWGEPRLTLDFFKSLGRALPAQTLLILAEKSGRYIAGAFAMRDHDTLYGRHWGCVETLPFLHFELCYYQTIEHAIRHGLRRLDAGVQGEHKLARGFSPVAMPSAHWIREADFRRAIEQNLRRETAAMTEHIEMLRGHLPYKQDAAG